MSELGVIVGVILKQCRISLACGLRWELAVFRWASPMVGRAQTGY